jgi:hypothetical protein
MRVTVGLADGHDPAEVAAALRREGAQDVRPSGAGVLVAEFPEGEPTTIIDRVQRLAGVRFAEQDAMRWAL